MNAIRCYILLFTLIGCSVTFAQNKPVSIAYYQPPAGLPEISENFYKRIANAGYEYLMVPVPILGLDPNIIEWENGEYSAMNDTRETTFLNCVKRSFRSIHKLNNDYNKNIRMIPIIVTASKHSGDLFKTNKRMKVAPLYVTNIQRAALLQALEAVHNPFTDILMKAVEQVPKYSIIDDPQTLTKKEYAACCPSFAPDKEGYDKTVRAIMDVIATAFEEVKAEAKLRNGRIPFPETLDYIFMGHDEPYTVDRFEVDYEHQLLPGLSQHDRDWIANNTEDRGGLKEETILKVPDECTECYTLAFSSQEKIFVDPQSKERVTAHVIVPKKVPCDQGEEPVYIQYSIDANGIASVRDQDKRLPRNFKNSPTVRGAGVYYPTLPNSEGIQKLMVEELKNRVRDVENATNGNSIGNKNPFKKNTSLIIFADLWDPHAKGGYFHVGEAAYLFAQNNKELVPKVVMQPWQYDETHRNLTNLEMSDFEFTIAPDLQPGMKGNAILNSRGDRYDPVSTMNFFQSLGFATFLTLSYGVPNMQPDQEYDRLILLYRTIDALKSRNQVQRVGYTSVGWWNHEYMNWGPKKDSYDQHYHFNVFEIASQSLNPARSHFPHKNMRYQNSLFYSYTIRAMNDKNTYIFIDTTRITKLDYTNIHRNLFDIDLDGKSMIQAKTEVSFLDAILFCNALSLREGKSPVYSVSGVVLNSSKIEDPKTITASIATLSADFSRNGYRLPRFAELVKLYKEKKIVPLTGCSEWIWPDDKSSITKDTEGKFGWCLTFKDGQYLKVCKTQTLQDPRIAYRVCRSDLK